MTYGELIYYLKGLCESAPTVNTVTQGAISNLDLDKANIYPLVHIHVESATFNEAMTMTYTVFISALQQRDISKEVVTDKFWRQDNEVDNHNETMLILQTIWSSVYRDWQDLYISSNDNPTFTKITYGKGNILDGWELQFDVELPFSVDLCDKDEAVSSTAPIIEINE